MMRFLVIEDRKEDVELIEFSLRKKWGDCQIDVLPDARKLHQIKTPQVYKAIISDYNFIVGNAMEVFEFLIDRRINIPCVIVSGYLTEDQVSTIEFLKMGGMVLKADVIENGHLLPNKVQHAIDNFQGKGATQMNVNELKFLVKRAEKDIDKWKEKFL